MNRSNDRPVPALLAAVTAMLLTSCSPAGVASVPSTGVSVPVEVSSNLPLVRASVNGSEEAWFVVDTGAEASVVDAEWADSLGLAVGEGMEVSTTGGTVDADLVTGATLVLDDSDGKGLELRDVTLVVVPLAGLEAAIGRPLGGILGADLFARYVVEFDHGALRLHEPETYRYEGPGEALPVRLEDGTPFVHAVIERPNGERIGAKLLLDTGASGALTLNAPFVDRHDLLASSGRTIALLSAAILAEGGAQRYVGRTAALHLGPVRVPDVLTTLAQDDVGDLADSSNDGFVGGDLLRRFKLVVDYGRERVILEPREELARPTDFDASGLSLGAVAPLFQALRVRLVLPGSPADEAGVAPGDALLGIDGRTAAELGLDGVRQLLRLVGEKHTLVLRRGQDTIETTITTRRLI